MKKLVQLLFVLMLLTLFFGCEEGKARFFEKEDFEKYTLVIIPNKTLVSSVKVNEFILSHKIESNFNQEKIEAIDVYVNGELVLGNEILRNKAGEYNIYAKYNDLESNKIKIEVQDPVLSKIEINPNKFKVKSNGTDIIKLEIKTIDQFGDTIEVTPSIYADGKPISINYSTNSAGIHKIYAKVGNTISDEIEIEAETSVQDIKLQGISYDFDESKKNYDLGKFDYDLEEINLELDGSDNNSKYRFNNGNWENYTEKVSLELLIGENKLEVKIDESEENLYIYELIRKDSESRLESLEIIDNVINFDLENKNYKLSLDNDIDSIELKATSKDKLSEISIYNGEEWKAIKSGTLSNKIDLNYGLNQIKIKVKAEDQAEKYETEYVLDIIRALNNTLSSLSVISNGEELIEEFDPMKTEYNLIVSSDASEVKIISEASGEGLIVKGDLGTFYLNALLDYTYVLYIDVETKYQINLHKENRETSLSEFKLDDVELSTIEKDQTKTVSNNINKLELKLVPLDKENGKVKIEIDGEEELVYSIEDNLIGKKEIELLSETTEIKIIIIAEDKNIEEERTLIIRKASTEANLKVLKVNGLNLDILEYTQNLETLSNNESQIKILVEKSIETQNLTLTVNGTNKNIETGKEVYINLLEGENTIDILVIPEEGETNKYSISLRRATNNTNIKSLIYNNKDYFENELKYYDFGKISSSIDKIEVEIEIEDDNSILEYKNNNIENGKIEIELIKGEEKEVEFKVWSEKKSTSKIYTVKVKRTNDKNGLEIYSNGTKEYIEGNGSYWLDNIKSDVSSVKIDLTLEDQNSSLTYKNENGDWEVISDNQINFNVTNGENEILIKVYAEDETINSKSYSVKVYKESNIVYLSKLEVLEGNFKTSFVKENENYETEELNEDIRKVSIRLERQEKSYSTVSYSNNRDYGYTELTAIDKSDAYLFDLDIDSCQSKVYLKVNAEDDSRDKIYEVEVSVKEKIEYVELFADKTSLDLAKSESATITYKLENQFTDEIKDENIVEIKIMYYKEKNEVNELEGNLFIPSDNGKYNFYIQVNGSKLGNEIEIDAHKIFNIKSIKRIRVESSAKNIEVKGDYAYLSGNELERIGLNDLKNYSYGVTDDCNSGIYIKDNLAYIAYNDNFKIVNLYTEPFITDLCSINIYDVLETNYSHERIKNMFVSENYLYIAMGTIGVIIFDINNKYFPEYINYLKSSTTTFDVSVKDKFMYTVDAKEGLELVDLKNTTKPEKIKNINISGGGSKIKILGNYAYMLSGYFRTSDGGLSIIDISNPIESYLLTEYLSSTSDYFSDMDIKEDYIYISAEGEGIKVLDNRDKSNLELLATYLPSNEGEKAKAIRVIDKYAYVIWQNSNEEAYFEKLELY